MRCSIDWIHTEGAATGGEGGAGHLSSPRRSPPRFPPRFPPSTASASAERETNPPESSRHPWRVDNTRSDRDRRRFLDRLGNLVVHSGAAIYAWALMPNHDHVALRTGTLPLSSLARRWLGPYATTFNRANRRVGHLFQNRFKSAGSPGSDQHTWQKSFTFRLNCRQFRRSSRAFRWLNEARMNFREGAGEAVAIPSASGREIKLTDQSHTYRWCTHLRRRSIRRQERSTGTRHPNSRRQYTYCHPDSHRLPPIFEP
jgi:hypothetical protein